MPIQNPIHNTGQQCQIFIFLLHANQLKGSWCALVIVGPGVQLIYLFIIGSVFGGFVDHIFALNLARWNDTTGIIDQIPYGLRYGRPGIQRRCSVCSQGVKMASRSFSSHRSRYLASILLRVTFHANSSSMVMNFMATRPTFCTDWTNGSSAAEIYSCTVCKCPRQCGESTHRIFASHVPCNLPLQTKPRSSRCLLVSLAV